MFGPFNFEQLTLRIIQREVERAESYHLPLCLAMMKHSHRKASAIQAAFRPADIVLYGWPEDTLPEQRGLSCVLFPATTSDEAMLALERVARRFRLSVCCLTSVGDIALLQGKQHASQQEVLVWARRLLSATKRAKAELLLPGDVCVLTRTCLAIAANRSGAPRLRLKPSPHRRETRRQEHRTQFIAH